MHGKMYNKFDKARLKFEGTLRKSSYIILCRQNSVNSYDNDDIWVSMFRRIKGFIVGGHCIHT